MTRRKQALVFGAVYVYLFIHLFIYIYICVCAMFSPVLLLVDRGITYVPMLSESPALNPKP